MLLDKLLYKILNCSIQQLSNYDYFFKTCTINRWEQLKQLNKRISDITSEQLVFLAVVEFKETDKFVEKNCHPADEIEGLHIGDQFKYYDINEKQKTAVLVGKAKDKMVVHFKGTSYRYDVCINHEIFADRAALHKYKSEPTKKVRMEEQYLSPIPEYVGLGFVNSILLVLFSNDALGRYFQQIGIRQEAPKSFIEYLSLIYHMLSSGGQVLPALIGDFMRLFFPGFFHFEMTMAEYVLKLLLSLLIQFSQLFSTNWPSLTKVVLLIL